MKILVQGINYYPELTGIGKYTAEMCEWLAMRGHLVEVITAMPYYPSWKIQSRYSGKLWHTEWINGVKVHRCPLYVPSKVTGFSRIIHESSFALSTIPYWIQKFFKKYDVVISVCPPFHIGLPALVYGTLKKTSTIYHVQDLQVDAAKNLQLIKSRLLLNIFIKTEAFIMRHMSRVSSISEGMKKNILKKGISENKYICLPNWVDVNFIKPLPPEKSLREELGFSPSDKIVLYSGNIGEKQGLGRVIEVAEHFRENKNLFFVLAGEGASKEKLLKMVEERKLQNIRFLPLQPYEHLAAMLAIADLHLILQKTAAADLVLPSKLMTVLAAGGASIVTAEPDTSLYDLIVDNNIGLIIPPEDSEALEKSIRANINEDLTTIKRNARNYAVNSLSIDQILTNFETELIKLTRIK